MTWRFGKQIRYASRKARADTRRRVKGRFVKAGEAYDYDPSETRDFWDKTADFGLPSTLSTLTNVFKVPYNNTRQNDQITYDVVSTCLFRLAMMTIRLNELN